ncbi:glutathione S-transferase alpha-4-like isoform X2 [Mytilus californianus]|uniref:glutathione S-transferase alpha-4-like isoform X2 n=1 Tax=Mytilus californianus TaxID=6549 RepID=UPI0022473E2C|nr:glutathione S-transferase alpha-4-like isoform X2 [Mytilus californianus]
MATKLTYFDGRGRAEIIRIMLAGVGLEYTEEYLTSKEQWEELKKSGKLLYNQVPLLEIDGLELVQTGAIVRYLAKKYNMYGSNELEAVKIDMYYEGSRDFYSVFIAMVFTDENECLKKVKEVMLPKYFPVYEKILKNCNTKYLVGDVVSFADVGLLECLLAVEEFLGMESIDSYPKIKEYYQKMKAEDRISTFLKGPHRKKRNTEEYVATVKKVLY